MSIDFRRSNELQNRINRNYSNNNNSNNSRTGRISSDYNHRTGPGSQRNSNKPYSKPSYSAPHPSSLQTISTGNVNERWDHDLFQPDSNLYGPKINRNLIQNISIPYDSRPIPSINPSPSLRPFGSLSTPSAATTTTKTPTSKNQNASLPAANRTNPDQKLSSVSNPSQPSSLQSFSSPNHLPPKPNVQSSNATLRSNINPTSRSANTTFGSTINQQSIPSSSSFSLLSRIQSRPSQNRSNIPPNPTNHALPLKPIGNSANTTTTTTAAAINPATQPKLAQNNLNVGSNRLSNQDSKSTNALSAQKAYEEAMMKYLNGPVILEVANLADGTSAEDVKTAFADFGDIQDCSTEEGPRQANQPTLKARMVFTNKAEAEKAVEALNGALADGLTLAVKIVGRPMKKPEKSEFIVQQFNNSIDNDGGENQVVSREADGDVLMENIDEVKVHQPTVPTGKLRSDLVAEADPRATLQSEPIPPTIYQDRILKILQTQQSQQQQQILHKMNNNQSNKSFGGSQSRNLFSNINTNGNSNFGRLNGNGNFGSGSNNSNSNNRSRGIVGGNPSTASSSLSLLARIDKN